MIVIPVWDFVIWFDGKIVHTSPGPDLEHDTFRDVKASLLERKKLWPPITLVSSPG